MQAHNLLVIVKAAIFIPRKHNTSLQLHIKLLCGTVIVIHAADMSLSHDFFVIRQDVKLCSHSSFHTKSGWVYIKITQYSPKSCNILACELWKNVRVKSSRQHVIFKMSRKCKHDGFQKCHFPISFSRFVHC